MATTISTDTVRVLIEGEETAVYRQYVDMPRDEFERLNAAFDSSDRDVLEKAAHEVGEWVNKMDVHDSRGFDLYSFERARPE